MSKNLPFWGESPQPAKTYYQMKLVCDVFGIVDHSKKLSNYTYLCDELAAGSKNTDHTISFLQHFIDSHIDSWVQNIIFCLDNARICICKYLLGWADQLVDLKRFHFCIKLLVTPSLSQTGYFPLFLRHFMLEMFFALKCFKILPCYIQIVVFSLQSKLYIGGQL